MARTKSSACRKSSGGKAQRKANASNGTPKASSSKSSKGSGGSKKTKGLSSQNSVCQRSTPEWQKKITLFLNSKSSGDGESSSRAIDENMDSDDQKENMELPPSSSKLNQNEDLGSDDGHDDMLEDDYKEIECLEKNEEIEDDCEEEEQIKDEEQSTDSNITKDNADGDSKSHSTKDNSKGNTDEKGVPEVNKKLTSTENIAKENEANLDEKAVLEVGNKSRKGNTTKENLEKLIKEEDKTIKEDENDCNYKHNAEDNSTGDKKQMNIISEEENESSVADQNEVCDKKHEALTDGT